MFTFYRIHPASEPSATVLDPIRPDGWVASDATRETQPMGVSCCESLEALRSYVETYGLAVQPGDRILVVRGHCVGHDRDVGAVRVIVSEIEDELPIEALEE